MPENLKESKAAVQIAKQSAAELKAFTKLCKQDYDTEKEATKAADAFINKCKYLSINLLEMKKVPVFETKGRPSKDAVPSATKYYIQGIAYTNIEILLRQWRIQKANLLSPQMI